MKPTRRICEDLLKDLKQLEYLDLDPTHSNLEYTEFREKYLRVVNQPELFQEFPELPRQLPADFSSLAELYKILVPLERILDQSAFETDFLIYNKDRFASSSAKVQLSIIAHNLRSAFNVGSLLRTAEALGVSEFFMTGYTPGGDHPKVKKTALGSEQSVPWKSVSNLEACLTELREKKIRIVGMETTEKSSDLYTVDLRGPCAFVLGNEKFGLLRHELQNMDEIIQIPTFGIKNSLNVSVAFGIAGYEWMRQSRLPKL